MSRFLKTAIINNHNFSKKGKKMAAYLFVHFTGTESSPLHEQVYFSVSTDGERWELLNGGKPVLVSDVGERGVRDPFIIRSPEERKFFIIGTDLSIFYRMIP